MSDLVGIVKDKIISELIMRLERLERRVLELERENAELCERLLKYENPKNSRNSSITPSKDENHPKKNQSLRKSRNRKPGGQPSHKGSTLEMTDDPRIVELRPGYCRSCGLSLEKVPSIRERARQLVDIPPVKALWTEYRVYARQCDCGCRTVADFPKGVDSP